jgi:hypothetical protein
MQAAAAARAMTLRQLQWLLQLQFLLSMKFFPESNPKLSPTIACSELWKSD